MRRHKRSPLPKPGTDYEIGNSFDEIADLLQLDPEPSKTNLEYEWTGSQWEEKPERSIDDILGLDDPISDDEDYNYEGKRTFYPKYYEVKKAKLFCFFKSHLIVLVDIKIFPYKIKSFKKY